MNVYDFDGTIYDGDSSKDFYLFCLKKNFRILRYIPKQVVAAILYKFNKINKTEMKERFFVFLNDIDTKKMLKEFWKKKEKNIKDWYLKVKKDDDLIISASPEFLLRPICEKIGIKNLIASNVNLSTGKFEGENCKGEKKVELFNEQYKDEKIEKFYSDSLSDQPLACIAQESYFVNGEKIEKWPKDNKQSKIKSMIKIYLLIYFIITSMYCSINGPHIFGEWDDYSVPAISIIKQHNISIDEQDIENFKDIFPEWAGFSESIRLSGYTTRKGGQMSWYFPVYSLVCVPFIQLLRFLGLPATYAFPYTNLATLMIMLLITYKYLKVDDKKKFLLIICLSINPIIFYLNWISAETFIFSLIGVTMVCWYNKWYKRAALTISIARNAESNNFINWNCNGARVFN